MERLNTAQVKVKRLQRLEAALVDFFMEVMDRSENNRVTRCAPRSLETESTFARGKRKEQYLKKAEGDPISLLNALRTHLRLQFAMQEAHQAAAERQAFAENLNNQQKELAAYKNFQKLELACDQLKDQQRSLLSQLNQHEVDQAKMCRQHQTLLQKLNAQLQEERCREQEAQQLISKQRQEISALKEARETLIKASQNQKSSLDGGRTPGTTTGGSFKGTSNSSIAVAATPTAVSGSGLSPSHINGDFFGTPAENQTLRRALRKYEVKMAQTEAANEERKREVQRLQQQLTGLRQSTQLQMYSRLEKESRHLRELVDNYKSRLAESEADLLRTKGALKERETQVQKMKDEYARLFNAVQKQKQPAHYSPSKLTRTASTMQLASVSQSNHVPQLPPSQRAVESKDTYLQLSDGNGSSAQTNSEHPYVVEHYRSEAARIERESEALKLQIRRMMASEQLHKQKTRVLRSEKQSLLQERDQLRADLDHAKKHSALQSITMNRQQNRSPVKTRKVGFSDVSCEMKQLQKRNAFLEERFRKSLQSNSALATIGAVARLRSSMSVPSGLGIVKPTVISKNASDSEVTSAESQDGRVPRHHSVSVTNTRPASAQATFINKANERSFCSLDTTTLQSLQQVRRATRVRPQSANQSNR
ncbi:unnamed protein product [Phytophthora lilii]|uniref:Unnamed protein product n=1 Tax=Phytophthora lilii TaxID=2077276 RepID=A0A9W6YED5_9STRA|nr:unnamed protein product [Phytophthora lilii]